MDKFFKEKKTTKLINNSSPIPWIQKYRPVTLDQMTYQDQIVNALKGILQSKQLPQLLFYGPAGTGKTSAILALSKQLFGQNYKQRTLELNASNQRGITIVREKIKNFSKSMVARISGIPSIKLIVLDQADSMTQDAQSALRRIIQDYSQTTRFCIICNYISKIIQPISSRCIKYRFKPIASLAQIKRLQSICQRQQVSYQMQALNRMVQITEGDLRKSINLLQLCSNTFEKKIILVDVDQISGIVNQKTVQQTLQKLIQCKDTTNIIQLAKQLDRLGIPVDSLLSGLLKATLSHNFSQNQICQIVFALSQTQRNLLQGSNSFLQIQALLLKIWGQLNLIS